jgi:hypothetical protein
VGSDLSASILTYGTKQALGNNFQLLAACPISSSANRLRTIGLDTCQDLLVGAVLLVSSSSSSNNSGSRCYERHISLGDMRDRHADSLRDRRRTLVHSSLACQWYTASKTFVVPFSSATADCIQNNYREDTNVDG